jgi:hypothetical protein
MGAVVTIHVDQQAAVDRPCVTLKRGVSNIVWEGDSDVRLLLVAFKEGATARLEDPACAGATCTLERAKHALRTGEFSYSVLVVRRNGSTASVDPKLIIQP